MRSAKASISSVVVRPLPHSRAMRRKGALVMPAMGASRARARISTEPIFMPSSVGLERPFVERPLLHDQVEVVKVLEHTQVLQGVALEHDEVGVLAGLDGTD